MASTNTDPARLLTREDLSSVWKDGGMTLLLDGNERFGMKLDLVKHLLQQREEPQWVKCKDRALAVLALHENSAPLAVLDVGCGLGIDTLAMAHALSKNPHGGRVVGVDMNTAMISYATQAAAEASVPANVKLEFLRADLTRLTEFADHSFDVVRSDITLQHVDLDAALKEIARILKPGGRLVALEGSAAGFYAKDEFVRSTYSRVIPATPNGGTGVQLYFKVAEHGLSMRSFEPFPIVNTGASVARADPGWVKLKGVGAMLVAKNVLSAEEAAEYERRYIAAAETQQILTLGFIFILVAQKQ